VREDPTTELRILTRQLEELNRIGAALAAERDTERLLGLILTKAREITSSDAGSLYVVETAPAPPPPDAIPGPMASMVDDEPTRQLRFRIAQNDAVSLPFREGALEITGESIAGYVALTGESVMLDDAYVLPEGVPYTFNRSFDEAAGYRTRSVLAVPMRTPKGNIVGVLQLLNAMAGGAVVPYSERGRALVLSLASQAAVALENSHLYAEIQLLFEGFVRASVVAIESRDPATSGHSFRVANLTVALAEAADRADSGQFAAVRFSREDMRTIRYASLLHDFGKVGVREEVLVKAKKLHPSQIDRVRERFRLARRTLEWSSARAALDYVLVHGAGAFRERQPAHDAELAEGLARLEKDLAEIERANEPNVFPDGSFERLREIARTEFPDVDGASRPLLREEEVRWLSLRKGSLSEPERKQIESHVMHTYRFLRQIPWTKEIRRIPAIALGHHEKLNGTGYPYKLSAADIPIQTRMMTIADIFDALSAADRPYKKAVPMERALEILGCAVKDGEIDAELFELFVDARVFERWLVEPHAY
jgi:HD-GYP domain-containing protein (c-di-GMP phosphodiesterase class II)